MDAAVPAERRTAPPGTIIETCPGAAATIHEVAKRLRAQGGAALFIDYGHAAVCNGSTLQAVRAHHKVDPFSNPGEADLTALVDFATLAPIAAAHGAKWLGTVTQGIWLKALGIEARAAALAAAAPESAATVQAAIARLTDDAEMGQLFKVMGLAAPNWPEGAGF
jgi:NADH dehydrogenase [ubiquinone] 1 alpha subcomplex assembly factor 7